MDSTSSSPVLAEQSPTLVEAMGDFAGGFMSLRDIRDILADELKKDASRAEGIRRVLDDALKKRRLSSADHAELVAGLRSPPAESPVESAVEFAVEFNEPEELSAELVPSENIPTEADENAPQQSGVYHVDDEGTLILAEDSDAIEVPTAFFDGVSDSFADEAGSSDSSDQPIERTAIETGHVLRDRFRLEEEIARGSMGVVYRAIDLLKLEAGAADPRVAVKLISPEFANHGTALKSFQNEIANTQHLSHPNIIHLFELDRDGDHYFITMEWLEGESLDSLLDRSRGSALPPTQTYAIIEQLCDALIYAHERNVVHSDIKPGNVFLLTTGELKLIDFGIARVDAESNPASSGGTVGLTPAYASCEALEKQSPTAQDDLYSLACMIYRLLAGRRVFGSKHALQAEQEGLQPVPIGGMPDSRWQALTQALAFRRADRQASVKEFAEAFGQRKEPREAKPEAEDEPAFSDTMTLDSIAKELLAGDTSALNALNETAELHALAGPDKRPVTKGDTTMLEPLNETAELHALAGVDSKNSRNSDSAADYSGSAAVVSDTTKIEELNETRQLAAMAGVDKAPPPEQPAADESEIHLALLAETAEVKMGVDFDLFAPGPGENNGEEVPYVDTVNLGEQPVAPEAEVPYVDTVNLGEGGSSSEVPFVDTVNLGDGPAMGAGAANPAAQVSVPADDAVKPRGKSARAKASQAPGPKVRRPEKTSTQQPAIPGAARVREQLRGANRAKQTAKRGLLQQLQQQPVAIYGSLAAVLLAIGLAAFLLSGNEQQAEPPAVAAVPEVAANAEPEFAPATDQGVLDEFAPAITDTEQAAADADDSSTAVTAAADSLTVASLAAETAAPVSRTPAIPAPSQSGNVPDAVAEPTAGAAMIANDELAPPVIETPAVPPVAATAEVVKPVVKPSAIAPSLPALPARSASSAPAESSVTALPAVPTVPAAASDPGAEPELVPAKADPQLLDGFINKAEAAIAAGRLIEPERDNAVYWFEQLRDNGAEAVDLVKVETQLVTAMISRAENAYIEGQLDDAQRWSDLAERYGASEAELTPVRKAIARVRRL